ncbi:unnamed protein product [Caenorhabditis angaria]|uniref:Uncharacterized protein n=1 Tax=Caenorhabditis angaria TaxID=860376 RepID=A0A9P1IQC4_9PELO|nr:unnamed protein product [Caenorhabditis angaria]
MSDSEMDLLEKSTAENEEEMDAENSARKPEAEAPDAEEEEEPLERTLLGDGIDSLMMHWCQLLTNVSVRAPVPPPSTLGHVKEVAEVCSKHFRDACVDVTNEFYRLGTQWEIENHEEHFKNEERDLDAAILRQNALLKKAREEFLKRTQHYSTYYPNATKHFTT